ncbi:ribonuclease P 40kDa subunit-domain-containing protein [Gamsiella multidivaricata]|uniref:ribonuclease P 40kDa subunit-domain-containing protein n=1 Tax=Gamsiella multidivaricata TaxID=101098 RepID=UPI00221F17D1|nr:ribonuclease P 40kDa subunit-domain-containing protein [Gamsiella multidivaricata]KAI7821945.1 ribonuclease P 40kDa subunit-domain-containing protein [Gamsiella multidivaricata]
MSTFFPCAEPPKAHLFMSHYSFNSPKDLHSRAILTHPFNHKIQVFLPTAHSEAIEATLTEALLRDVHYYHAHIPLSLFLTSTFMQYIRNGMVSLSIQGGIDTHDVVCLDGKGKLILSLTKDSYEQLGLIGTPSKFYPNRQRYVVEVDLRAPSMIPGKPGFERIKWCFENTLTTTFPMLLVSVTPEGVSLPLKFPDSARATKLSFNIQSTRLDSILIPDTTTIRTIGRNDLRWRKSVAELYEWIGMSAMQSERISLGDRVDSFLCVYSNPPQTTAEPVGSSGCLIEISGLIPSQSVFQIFESLRSVLPELVDPVWANFTVWGFQDAPVSWLGREHGHLLSGENMYSFFIWSSNLQLHDKEDPDTGIYVLLESVATYDEHS